MVDCDPDLAALIVYLAMDMRVTRRKINHFPWDVFGLQLSIGTLQNCIVESARAVEPVEAQLINELCRESLLRADDPNAGRDSADIIRLLLIVIESEYAYSYLR